MQAASADALVALLTQYVPLPLLVGILYLSFQYYARPHISFIELAPDTRKGSVPPQHTSTSVTLHRFLLNSFEPITIREPLHIRVEAPLGLTQIAITGGPWFDSVHVQGNTAASAPSRGQERTELPPKLPKAIILKFSGFPAEGTMSLTVGTLGAGAVRLSVDESSVAKPRSFRPTPPWESAKLGKTVVRSALGAFTALVIFNLFVPISSYAEDKVHYLVLFGLILLAAPTLWTLVSPFGGKEVIQGFLGGGTAVTTSVWPEPGSSSESQSQ